MDTVGDSRKSLSIDHSIKSYMTSSLLQSIIIIIVVTMSIYNLTFSDNEHQFWRDILMFCIGLVVPSPNAKIKKYIN